jgi:Putative restriction endonuclease
MSTQPHTFLTPQEYLEMERKAAFRSEYRAGEMFAMAGATRAHNLINTNAVAELRDQLRHSPCEVYSKDMRVYIPAAGLSTKRSNSEPNRQECTDACRSALARIAHNGLAGRGQVRRVPILDAAPGGLCAQRLRRRIPIFSHAGTRMRRASTS